MVVSANHLLGLETGVPELPDEDEPELLLLEEGV